MPCVAHKRNESSSGVMVSICIDPGAPPVTDEAHKIVFQRKAGKISRESDALALLRHGRFHERRLRQLPVLIGLERFLVGIPLQRAF